MTPGWTTATKSRALISMMRFIRANDRTMPPRDGTQPPTYPKPAPRAVTAMWCRLAKRRMVATERVPRGSTTASGNRLANHLSPECFWRMAGSNCSSPAGRRFFNSEKTLRRREVMVILENLRLCWRTCPVRQIRDQSETRKILRIVSPHPSPLPWGAGEPVSARRTFHSRRLSTAYCALFPLPEGEGQGEGNGGAAPRQANLFALARDDCAADLAAVSNS